MWKGHLPSKTNTTAVAHAVTKDLAGHNLIGVEDGNQLLEGVSQLADSCVHNNREKTYRLSHRLGQVGDVQVGRAVIPLGLEAGVEALLLHSS